MEMLEQSFELVANDLESMKSDMLREIKAAQYSLSLMIVDLEENREYRDNVPDQVISRLAKQYSAYVEKKKTLELIKGSFDKDNEKR